MKKSRTMQRRKIVQLCRRLGVDSASFYKRRSDLHISRQFADDEIMQIVALCMSLDISVCINSEHVTIRTAW